MVFWAECFFHIFLAHFPSIYSKFAEILLSDEISSRFQNTQWNITDYKEFNKMASQAQGRIVQNLAMVCHLNPPDGFTRISDWHRGRNSLNCLISWWLYRLMDRYSPFGLRWSSGDVHLRLCKECCESGVCGRAGNFHCCEGGEHCLAVYGPTAFNGAWSGQTVKETFRGNIDSEDTYKN